MNKVIDFIRGIYFYPTDRSILSADNTPFWLPPVNLLFGWMIVPWLICLYVAVYPSKWEPNWRNVTLPSSNGETHSDLAYEYNRLEACAKMGTKSEYDKQFLLCQQLALVEVIRNEEATQ